MSIVKYANIEDHALDRQVTRLTDLFAEATGHPRENVHRIFEPAGKGRVAFGGTMAK